MSEPRWKPHSNCRNLMPFCDVRFLGMRNAATTMSPANGPWLLIVMSTLCFWLPSVEMLSPVGNCLATDDPMVQLLSDNPKPVVVNQLKSEDAARSCYKPVW